MGKEVGGKGWWAGLLGLDFNWFIEGAGADFGDLGANKLSTFMFIAPVVSAQVAPTFVVFVLFVVIGCGCWLLMLLFGAIGCSRPRVGWIPVEFTYIITRKKTTKYIHLRSRRTLSIYV